MTNPEVLSQVLPEAFKVKIKIAGQDQKVEIGGDQNNWKELSEHTFRYVRPLDQESPSIRIPPGSLAEIFVSPAEGKPFTTFVAVGGDNTSTQTGWKLSTLHLHINPEEWKQKHPDPDSKDQEGKWRELGDKNWLPFGTFPQGKEDKTTQERNEGEKLTLGPEAMEGIKIVVDEAVDEAVKRIKTEMAEPIAQINQTAETVRGFAEEAKDARDKARNAQSTAEAESKYVKTSAEGALTNREATDRNRTLIENSARQAIGDINEGLKAVAEQVAEGKTIKAEIDTAKIATDQNTANIRTILGEVRTIAEATRKDGNGSARSATLAEISAGRAKDSADVAREALADTRKTIEKETERRRKFWVKVKEQWPGIAIGTVAGVIGIIALIAALHARDGKTTTVNILPQPFPSKVKIDGIIFTQNSTPVPTPVPNP